MTGCLTDRALHLLYDGEGSSAERTHLKECEVCATRYRQLGQDLEAITRILRAEPPPQRVRHGFRPVAVRWLPTAAALGLALMLMWEGARIWSPTGSSPLQRTYNGETWSLLDEFPSLLFLLNEALAAELATEGSGSLDLAARVLEAERPCEWYDLPVSGRAELAMEDLEFSEGTRPAPCIEIN